MIQVQGCCSNFNRVLMVSMKSSRDRGKPDDRQCKLCGDECESVTHVHWECPVYNSIRNTFVEEKKKKC